MITLPSGLVSTNLVHAHTSVHCLILPTFPCIMLMQMLLLPLPLLITTTTGGGGIIITTKKNININSYDYYKNNKKKWHK
jgi:hypothetical protein